MRHLILERLDAMQNMKALVVDDSKVGRLTMQKKLEAFGIGVDLAESGLEALQYLERNRPDMIFMDHMMPDLDGFEATRRIKASPATRDIPVIIISGSDDEAFVRDARAIGALDAIAKPPANDAIERILASLPRSAAAGQTTEPKAMTTVPVAQSSMKAMIEAEIHAAIERLQGDWLKPSLTRLEAEIENERQLQQARNSRFEQRLEQTAVGLADSARLAADVAAMRQQLQGLETRLLALESQAARMATPSEAWIEAADERIRLRLAELDVGAERHAAGLDTVRQELLRTLADRHAEVEQTTRALSGRIDAMAETMQQRLTNLQACEDRHGQRLGAIEQRLASLETAGPLPGLDEAWLASIETRLLERFTDMLEKRHEPLLAELDRLRDQLDALEQSQAALVAQGEGWEAQVQARLAQLRAELDAALQSAASDRQAAPQAVPGEPHLEAATDQPSSAMTEPAAGIPPAAGVDGDSEARLMQRLADEWNGRWQAEVQRLKGTVKALTWATAAGGIALLAAVILLAR
jgi:CheY-like chemotaxis protein